jgi:hypothetical protein
MWTYAQRILLKFDELITSTEVKNKDLKIKMKILKNKYK